MSVLPESGSVVGVDVGYSTKVRSSAVCRLTWTPSVVEWRIVRFRHDEAERCAAMSAVVADHEVIAAAFDGPLSRGFSAIGRYRVAEAALTVRLLREAIGKPGQSSSRNGRDLNAAANACVRSLTRCARLGRARHAHAIDDLALVEAFPTSFLGLMITNPGELQIKPPARSDAYFEHLAESGGLDQLLSHLLPRRAALLSWSAVTNHDDRAALVCALTALAVAMADYTAVGDDDDGWIILPPRHLIAPWALGSLR